LEERGKTSSTGTSRDRKDRGQARAGTWNDGESVAWRSVPSSGASIELESITACIVQGPGFRVQGAGFRV